MSAISFHLVPIFFIHVCLMWEYLMTKFFVGLVNVPLREDVEGGADKSKESGVEVDRAVRIQGHVHGDETLEVKVSTLDNAMEAVENLAGHAMRTELSKAQWGRDFPGKIFKVWKKMPQTLEE